MYPGRTSEDLRIDQGGLVFEQSGRLLSATLHDGVHVELGLSAFDAHEVLLVDDIV